MVDTNYEIGMVFAAALGATALVGALVSLFLRERSPWPKEDPPSRPPVGCATLCEDCLDVVDRPGSGLQVLWALAPVRPALCALCRAPGRFHARILRVTS